MSQPVVPPSPALSNDVLNYRIGYLVKIHLLGISPHIYRRVLVRGDTFLAELHPIFQVTMGWENWHLHSFKRWGKEYGIPYAGGIYISDDARRIRLGDFPWRATPTTSAIPGTTRYGGKAATPDRLVRPPGLRAWPPGLSSRGR